MDTEQFTRMNVAFGGDAVSRTHHSMLITTLVAATLLSVYTQLQLLLT